MFLFISHFRYTLFSSYIYKHKVLQVRLWARLLFKPSQDDLPNIFPNAACAEFLYIVIVFSNPCYEALAYVEVHSGDIWLVA